MMGILKKIKNVLTETQNHKRAQLEQLAELEWAHIYKETIRGKKWLEELGISPGRWAGNYSFFYILTRILADYQPKRIIEFGLGESSKLISTFVENELINSTHLIIEQSAEWIEKFNSRFSISPNTNIKHLPLTEKIVKQFPVNCYEGIETCIKDSFDLYIVDGPFGSDHYSRYDICVLAENFKPNADFIIIIDDFNRQGEKETATSLIDILNKKGIKIYTGSYSGNKSQLLIATEIYKYAISL
jgi:hypothetical protein